MDFTNYKIANIKDKSEIRERLKRIEEDMSRELNEDIVLIAFQKDENTISNM